MVERMCISARLRSTASNRFPLMIAWSFMGMGMFIANSYASFPYNPTYLLKSPDDNDSIIYLLEPPSNVATSGRLLSFNAAKALSSDDLSTIEVSNSLPFIQTGDSVSYTAVLDSDESILVYSGNCSASANASAIWRFTPDKSSSTGRGSWSQLQVDKSSDTTYSLVGPNYLASAFSYSYASNAQNSNMYMFGGICPTEEISSTSQSFPGEYSDQMAILAPESNDEYKILVDAVGGHPIAEAGSSLTPLIPSYSNASDGIQTVEQDFVLVGGNTQTAFINMTQLAIFSLPQAEWNFVSVAVTMIQTDSTEDPPILEPRSGHSATLTTDGSQIVIFGGWVGNTSTAAEPQLAILNLGVGYGGDGGWSWDIPTQVNSPFTDGQGVYGHGASMLAGNIMMATGGYTIRASMGSSMKRDNNASNDQNYFFNVTSGTWISSYDGSAAQAPPLESTVLNSKLSSSQKAGLGGGLAFGLLALLVAIVFGLLYWRKLKRKNQSQYEDGNSENEIENLSELAKQGAYNFEGHWSTDQVPHEIVQTRNAFRENGSGIKGWNNTEVRNAERTGLDFEIPSPHRGLRRSMRPNYYMAPRFDDGQRSRFPGHMHAIEERSEEGSSTTSSRQPSGSIVRPPKGFAPVPASDPFQDPGDQDELVDRLGIDEIPNEYVNNDLPSPADERQKEMTEWIKDWAAVDAIQKGRSSPTKTGRISPEKSDRTSSTLSEKSNYSTFSGSIVPSRGPSARSQRYHGPSSALQDIPYRDYPSHEMLNDHIQEISRPGTAGADSDSFITAKSAVSGRQTEIIGLLDEEIRPDEEPDFSHRNTSFANRYRSIGVMGGIVGSVKRAIPRAIGVATGSGANRSVSLTNTISRPMVIGKDGYYDYSPTKEDLRSTASSPTKKRMSKKNLNASELEIIEQHENPFVRRSVSDGAAKFWESKRGAHGWNFKDKDMEIGVDHGKGSTSRPSSMHIDHGGDGTSRSIISTRDGSRSRQSDFSEDWDIEAAIEERVVQVMFTVPREKLRVVNADPKKDRTADTASDEE